MYSIFTYHYDWVDPSDTRTREEYPYSFSDHYIWREEAKMKGSSTVHVDRMFQQDYEKAKLAFGNLGQRGNYTKAQCKDIIRKYFGEDMECVGFSLSCNISTGYEIGTFYIKTKK